ncbi:DUF6059 family protein [Kitasatospora sp. NPDC006697]|uniref:DUF6059 family protein n=1 Tax=Kitasatospora sp. NPDC006697 TaxID=3364020 RepID=UPI0036CAC7D6
MYRVLYAVARRCARRLLAELVAFGLLWMHVPDPPAPAGSGPGPRHPERLCPEVPLSAVELQLARELGLLPYRTG